MEGFQGEDRHNPLPHIAPSTTALKSGYRNTASLSTRTATELRELPDPDGLVMAMSRIVWFDPGGMGCVKCVLNAKATITRTRWSWHSCNPVCY
jgi:hypothetical protein